MGCSSDCVADELAKGDFIVALACGTLLGSCLLFVECCCPDANDCHSAMAGLLLVFVLRPCRPALFLSCSSVAVTLVCNLPQVLAASGLPV